MIQYIVENTTVPHLEKKKLNAWIKDVAATYNQKTGDIAFVFCNDDRILEVNKQYLQHDYFTDIITFDYTEGNRISGDIFISIDTVKSNASEFQQDFLAELHRIIIHGILHLCGNDDKTPELRKEMTQKENNALALLEQMR